MRTTPGPWRVVPNRNNESLTVVGSGNYGAIANTTFHRPDPEENEANARLIAQAPTMADFLVRLIAPENAWPSGFFIAMANEALDILRDIKSP